MGLHLAYGGVFNGIIRVHGIIIVCKLRLGASRVF